MKVASREVSAPDVKAYPGRFSARSGRAGGNVIPLGRCLQPARQWSCWERRMSPRGIDSR